MYPHARNGFSATAIIGMSLALIATAPDAAAAQTDSELVDRIIAIVGDTVVLQSEVQERLIRMQAQGARIPDDPRQFNELMNQVVEQVVNETLIVLHARREGISVLESEIETVVDDRLADVRRRFRTELEYHEALQRAGVTAAEFRIQQTEQVRTELMTRRYLRQRISELRPVPVSEGEIRERFEAQKEMLGPKPETLDLKHVLVVPSPSEDARAAAKANADEALRRARAGDDFAMLARQYSDDLATRPEGGDLGWVRRGQLLPEFETALFNMQVGDISNLVETSVGFHIIKLERVRGAERLARHMLFRPEMTPADTELGRQLAEDVAAALRVGADPDSLIRLYGDPQERGTLTDFPRDRLPAEYQAALSGAAAGDVVGPFNVPAPTVPGGKWAVVLVQTINSGGEWTLDDVRDTLRQQIEQDRMLEQVVRNLRQTTYIEMRMIGTSGIG